MGPVAPPEAVMTRRRLLLTLGAALAVLVAVSVAWRFVPRTPGITLSNCARIRKSMSREQVQALLGAPAGDYRTGGGLKVYLPHGLRYPVPPYERWDSNEVELLVWFDGQDRVAEAAVFRLTPSDPGFLEMLRRSVGW